MKLLCPICQKEMKEEDNSVLVLTPAEPITENVKVFSCQSGHRIMMTEKGNNEQSD